MKNGILVIILAILFIIIATMFIIGYFVLNKKKNDYVEVNNDLDIGNDEKKVIQEENNVIDDIVENNIDENDYIESEIKDEIEEANDISLVTPIIDTMRDVINVMINNKNYVFLANNNIVNVNDHIKLSLNGKEYHGVITKGIYQKDINDFKIAPQNLIIIEKE